MQMGDRRKKKELTFFKIQISLIARFFVFFKSLCYDYFLDRYFDTNIHIFQAKIAW